ncbi:MAG: ComF family protein [Roseomonas sp.]|jgi:ComF family protein|nr:ComF family protein [Roseomonas sp.]MCA3282056.1 ComF family protein [Roseomonas sp.]MCA3299169.1 ComF family protein [Roseomonas sp.]
MPSGALLNRLRSGFGRAPEKLLDILLPPHCLTCDAQVERQGSFCATCFSGLNLISAPFCARCGVPFAHEGEADRNTDGALLCAPCLARAPGFTMARAALRYDEGAKRLILPFKHGDRTEMAVPLARFMARAGAEMLSAADVLAPVPAHWRRLIARRYDQAALLAQRLGRLSGRRVVPDLLRRTRATLPLGDKGAAERAALVADAFSVARPARVLGKRVLLVDDVMTSGATAEACARALLAAGAARVEVLAAARVPDPRLCTA